MSPHPDSPAVKAADLQATAKLIARQVGEIANELDKYTDVGNTLNIPNVAWAIWQHVHNPIKPYKEPKQ